MVTRKATIQNSAGIHLRPSGVVMQAIEGYGGKVELKNDNMKVEVDSIMSIVALGLAQGDTVIITVDGPDEERFADELVAIFETHFDFPPRV